MEAVILFELILLTAGIWLYVHAGYCFQQEAKKIDIAQETNPDQINWWKTIENERYNLRISAVLILIVGHLITWDMLHAVA